MAAALPPRIDAPSAHHSDRGGAPILGIVIHATAGRDSLAWLRQNPRQVSAHWLIAKDGTCYRMVSDDRAAHHVGNSRFTLPNPATGQWKTYTGKTRPNTNQVTLGIELENLNDGRDPYPDAQLAALGWAIRDAWQRHGLVPLIRHGTVDTAGKTDPATLDYTRLYLLARPDDLTFISPPRITPEVFSAVLAARRSPAMSRAAHLYGRCVHRGVCPGVALAFYEHESSCGTAGAAQVTNSWGNNRKSRGRATKVGPVKGSSGNFAHYASIDDALEDWLDHILLGYVGGDVLGGISLPTVGAAIPIYAPSSDNNKPLSYLAAVLRDVNRWRAAPDPWAAWGDAAPLVPEWSIPRRWAQEGNLGPALGPEQHRPGGGAAVQWFANGAVIWLGGERTEVVRL